MIEWLIAFGNWLLSLGLCHLTLGSRLYWLLSNHRETEGMEVVDGNG